MRVALLVLLEAIATALGLQWTASLSSSSATARRPDVTRAPRAPLGEADGAVPDGTTVFDHDVPGVAKLDSDLRGALRRAATDAANDGGQFRVDSGWRSPAYQEHLLFKAISKYGSTEEAARWVATPDRSAHVSGDAGRHRARRHRRVAVRARRRVWAVPDLQQRALALRAATQRQRARLARHVRRPHRRSKGAATMKRFVSRPLVALALAGLIGLISAGCGSNASSEHGTATSTADAGSTSSSGTASGAAKKLTARDKAVKFAECIRAHGVGDFPDPDEKNQFQYGVSVTPVVWKKAVTACKDLQPPGTLSGKRTPKQQSAGLRFAACVREHGVKDFPDPVNGEPLIDTYKIPSSNKPGGMAILNAATQKCGSVLGEAAARGQGGTGG